MIDFNKGVIDILENFMVAKNLTDDKPYPIEFQNSYNDYFYIHRKHSGNHLDIDVFNDEKLIEVQCYHRLPDDIEEKLISNFNCYQRSKKHNINSFFESQGIQMQNIVGKEREFLRFRMKSPQELYDFLQIMYPYI